MDTKHILAEKESRELNQAEDLMNEGKFDEALSLLNSIKKESLTDSDKLVFSLIKSSLLSKLGNFSEAYRFAEQVYQKSEKLNNPSLIN